MKFKKKEKTMKKILVLGILVLFLGSLIAAESGPSDTVGFIKYGMVVGSTFIANPMDAGYTTSALMGDAITSADQMSYWDASSQGWVSSIKNLFGNWVGPFATDIGMALQVRGTAVFNWPVADAIAGEKYVPTKKSVITRSNVITGKKVKFDAKK